MRAVVAIVAGAALLLAIWHTSAHPERSGPAGAAESKGGSQAGTSLQALAAKRAAEDAKARSPIPFDASIFPGGPVEEKFESALLEADSGVVTDADALESARLLEHAIRAKDGRARDAAVLLGKIAHRSLAFRAALIVGRSQQDPLVRAALLEQARRGAGFSREVVAYSFYGKEGDAEVARAMAEGFLDEKAPPAVRAAQAFAAASMLKELSETERAKVREAARKALRDPALAEEIRVEALDLLDVKGADRQQARDILEKSGERKVALSAARVLLRAGEDEKYVKGELMRFASSEEGADIVSKSLKEILEEGRPGM